jgi:hypothetical protein
MYARKLILPLLLALGFANSAPLLMLPLESDIDSSLSLLWENSIKQILKEANFEPMKIEHNHFSECESIECVLSAARASGTQGLFRGRLRADKDSVNVRFRIDWLAGSSAPQSDIQGTAPLAWDDVLRSGILLKLLSGITGKGAYTDGHTEERKTVVAIETNPENAIVMLNGNAVCQSPCTFSDSSSMLQIAAYWNSGENLWAAKTVIRASKDTSKVFLELKRSFAGTEIRTNPDNALIFPAGILDVNSKAIGKTPYNMQGLPGETQIMLFREGYNDTMLNVRVDAVEKQIQFVQLTPITNPQKIYEQSLFVKSRNKRNVGLGLFGGSIVPLIAGTMLCVLAQDDYQKAKDIKKDLYFPSFGGENFKAKVDENNKAVKDGNYKTAFGAGLIGFSVLLAGVGFSMSF